MRHLCSELTPIESDTPFLQAATCTGPIGSSRKAGLDGLYVSPPHLHWEVSHLFPSQRLSRDFISLGLHSGPMVQACSVFLVLDQKKPRSCPRCARSVWCEPINQSISTRM